MSGDVSPYTGLITPEHADKPLFVAVISALCQGPADAINVLQGIPALFDIDVAVGDQLDTVGEWVGLSRELEEPLVGVYFALDTDGVGLDQGIWLGPFDPTSGLVALPDAIYRQLLYAKIGDNNWDGNVPEAYAFMQPLFVGSTFFIQDNMDMGMFIGAVGPQPLTTLELQLLKTQVINVKPAGVSLDGVFTPSVQGDAIFGTDANNGVIAGFDVGSWAVMN